MSSRVSITGRLLGGRLHTLKEEDGDSARYNALLLLDEGQEDKVNAAVEHAINEKWGKKKPSGLATWGVREGDDEEYSNTFGKLFINPKTKDKPQLFLKHNGRCSHITKESGIIYPGCYVALSISAYAMDGVKTKEKTMPPTVSLSLRGVLFVRDGDPLSDVVDGDLEFQEFEDSEVSADFDDFDL
jgi:hypothetical protein